MRRRPPADADDLLVKTVAMLMILFAGLLAYRVLRSQAEASTPLAVEQASVPQPTPEQVAEEIRRIALEAQLQALRAQRQAPQPVPPEASELQQRRARCESQKRYRDQELEQVGRRRTPDLTRELNDQVHEACKDT